MTEQEFLNSFGLPPRDQDLEKIRDIVRSELSVGRQNPGCGNTDVLKLCCVQLFGKSVLSDTLHIWACKRLSEEAGFAIDIQLLCGAGLAATKDFLASHDDPRARSALDYIYACEETGDFEGFVPKTFLDDYIDYYLN